MKPYLKLVDTVIVYYRQYLDNQSSQLTNNLIVVELSPAIFRLSFEQMSSTELYTTLTLKFASLDSKEEVISESPAVNILIMSRFDEGLSFRLSSETYKFWGSSTIFPSVVDSISGIMPNYGI